MRTQLKRLPFALFLAGTTLIGATVANAASVTFDIGNVAVGYTDGYYDNDHHWHRWAHRADATRFRRAHKDQYHGYRHDDPKHR